MSLSKRLKSILEEGDIDERYLAASFLIRSPEEVEHYASKYNLQVRKLKEAFLGRLIVERDVLGHLQRRKYETNNANRQRL